MYMHLCIGYFNKYCTIKFYNEYEKKQFLKKGSKTTNRYKIKRKDYMHNGWANVHFAGLLLQWSHNFLFLLSTLKYVLFGDIAW